MTTRADILVPVGGGEGDAALLAFAADLAPRLSATATALLMQPDPIETLALTGEPGFAVFSPTVLDGMKQGLEELAEATRARVDAVPGLVFEAAVGVPEAILPRRASLVDFALVSCACARNHGLMAGVCETLLMEARVPVLVARGTAAALTGPAVIAFDGGPESGRALRRALPLLRLSNRVVVAQATQPLQRAAARYTEPQRAIDFLAAHGVTAEITMLPEADHEAQALLHYAASLRAGLLVAGAYGHSRLQQFVFGGATKAFLAATGSPALFLVH